MSGRNAYLLLDSWSRPLAKGTLVGSDRSEMLQIRVLDGRIDDVTGHEIIQLLAIEDDDRALKCRLVRSRDDNVVLERLEVMDSSLRKNLRIPVCFDSFLYLPGDRKGGRSAIRSLDLSCGGIAFYGRQGLEVGALVEIVIPITEQPLIVTGRILRVDELKNGKSLYAAVFVDLCHDEEKTIRRAVFNIQIRNDRA